MRSRTSSWITTLIKLGLRRQFSKNKRRHQFRRTSRVESLESRQMLAADYIVDTHLDVVDGGDGLLSLREAISAAAAGGGEPVVSPHCRERNRPVA
jgi:hypothetical protein